MKYFLLYLLLLISITSFASQTELTENEVEETHRNIAHIQYFLSFPPFWDKHQDGTFSGTHYRLAKALYAHAGLKVKFVHAPYQRMQFQVEQGKASFINYGEVKGVNTNEIVHICVPPTTITLKVYYLKEELSLPKVPEDFSGKNVIIMHGLPLGEYEVIKSDSTINFMLPRSIDAALEGLEQGRGDFFITFDNLMAGINLESIGSRKLKSFPLYNLLGYPIVTPKTYPNGKALCDKVYNSYLQLVDDGKIDKDHKVLISDVNK